MVYFIQGEQTKRIKIGKAADVLVRLKGLQCGSPDCLTILKVLLGTNNDRSYHARFEADKVYGEWFSPSDPLLAFIDSIPASKFDGRTYLPRDRTASKIPVELTQREYPLYESRQRIPLSKRLLQVSGLDEYFGRTSTTTNAW